MAKIKIVLILFLALASASCSSRVYKLNTNFGDIPKREMFKQLSTLLERQHFAITDLDSADGYIEAELITDSTWTMFQRHHQKRIWRLEFDRGQLTATAEIKTYDYETIFFIGFYSLASRRYFNDAAPCNWYWYWNVRNGLEMITGSNITIN